MSRIGKQPITIPKKVEVNLEKGLLTITGPKGKLSLNIPNAITVSSDGEIINVVPNDHESKEGRALWGTIQRLISNNVIGVTEGFSKKLNITGVGYRAKLDGKKIELELGFSHKIEHDIPEDIEIKVEGNNTIIVSGINKQKVGQVAAEIRNYKKPEPYKGKGISYEGEVIRRKAGKQAASAA